MSKFIKNCPFGGDNLHCHECAEFPDARWSEEEQDCVLVKTKKQKEEINMTKPINTKIVGEKLEVETPYGKIVAMPTNDSLYPGIYLNFIKKGEEIEIPLALVEVTNALAREGKARLLVWNPEDPQEEDYCEQFIILEGKEKPRVCSDCGKEMTEGYCINDGEEYYCSKECLNKHYTEKEFLEMYYGVGEICGSDITVKEIQEWDEDEQDRYMTEHSCAYWTRWNEGE